MSIFDSIKQKAASILDTVNNVILSGTSRTEESTSDENQTDERYPDTALKDSMFERTVITFEERKKTTYPSKNGLYVAEILLLSHCSDSFTINPENEYARSWWLDYGVKDINGMLCSLEKRGFVRLCTIKENLPLLRMSELKEILEKLGLSTTGRKKADLVARILENADEETLRPLVTATSYTLTELGKAELESNEYVPYMHNHRLKTVDGSIFGRAFNVWSINKKLHELPCTDWRALVAREETALIAERDEHNDKTLAYLENADPELAERLKAQDAQLKKIQRAEDTYIRTQDIEKLISFWANLWASGGLNFNGSKWTFRLPDLYIQTKQFDKALAILEKIRQSGKYTEKTDSYIQRVNKLNN